MTFERILVGTDGSETAGRAVADAARLAVLDGAGLVIVTAFGGSGGAGSDEAAERLAGAVEIAREVGHLDAVGAAVEGDPGEALIAAAEERRADLLVVGSKGMTDTTRFVLGSVANHVSHHASCDVLISRTGNGGPDFRPAAVSGNIVP
jgi:nucleotide-binding universal stress UspA family protein